MSMSILFIFFFFNDTATTEIYTLSLHELFRSQRADVVDERPALVLRQMFPRGHRAATIAHLPEQLAVGLGRDLRRDRKSTRLNSSHGYISYAVFCLKKKIIYRSR